MQLAHDRIQDLATREGVDENAVWNFLCSIDGLTRDEARANLVLDTRSYCWSTATGRAIQQGIEEAR